METNSQRDSPAIRGGVVKKSVVPPFRRERKKKKKKLFVLNGWGDKKEEGKESNGIRAI